VKELGTKADAAKDRIEGGESRGSEGGAARLHFAEQAAGSGVSDGGSGRAQDAAKLFAGFAGAVFPVGNLEYAASGLVFLTNDGDLARRC